jgi:hypothetical protein
MQREKKTIAAMIDIYCRAHHNPKDTPLCHDCTELLNYANKRLEKCPYAPDKPPCSKCETHCYKPQLREKIKQVMKFAGPKMIKKHPLLALNHLIKGIKNK